MTILMKNNNKLKVSPKKNKVDHLLSYKCPSCGERMGKSVQSAFTRVDYGYEIWVCEKCRKLWRLTFQELVSQEDKK